MKYKNLKGPSTPAQLALIKKYGIKLETSLSKQEASDLITTLINEKRPKPKPKTILRKNQTLPAPYEAPRDKWGRKHGLEAGIGTGEAFYQHGVMSYCDDGNGNTWHEEFELFTEEHASFWGLDD